MINISFKVYEVEYESIETYAEKNDVKRGRNANKSELMRRMWNIFSQLDDEGVGIKILENPKVIQFIAQFCKGIQEAESNNDNLEEGVYNEVTEKMEEDTPSQIAQVNFKVYKNDKDDVQENGNAVQEGESISDNTLVCESNESEGESSSDDRRERSGQTNRGDRRDVEESEDFRRLQQPNDISQEGGSLE